MTLGGAKLSCSEPEAAGGLSRDRSQLGGDVCSRGSNTVFRGPRVRVGGYLGQQAVSVII